MKKRFSLVLILLLALSTFLAACGGKDKDEKAGDGDNSKSNTKKEQVLNLNMGSEIPSMDSTLATDSVSFEIMDQVYEGLYRLGEGDKAVEGVADGDPQISEDGKTWTVKLRDTNWSNGEPVTAKDFVYSWQRAMNPKTGAEYAYIMYDVKNAAKVNAGELPVDQLGIKAIDDKTLEIQLENPVPYFKELLTFATFYPENQKFVEAQGDKYGLETENMLFNGPFVFADWKHEQKFTLKKNKDYWDADTVKLEEINYDVVKDTATAINLYNTNKLDKVGLTSEFVDKYKDDKNFKTRKATSVYFLRLNEKNELLKNADARHALDMGWDKQGFVDVLLNNGSVPAYYLVPKDFVKGPDGKDFRSINGDMNKTDVKKAQEYWEKAKKALGKDTFTLEMLNYDDDNSKKIGEFVKEQLETNLKGLTVNIKQQPFKQKLDLETKGDYDFSFAGWGPDYPDPMTFIDMFVTDGAHNQMGYSNPEYDKLVADGKSSLLTDPAKRWEALAKAEKILFDDAAISPMYQKGSSYLERPYVKNILVHAFGSDYSYKWAYIE